MGRKKKAGKEFKDDRSSKPADAGKSEQKEDDKLSEAAGGQPLQPTDKKPPAVGATSKGGDGNTQDPPELRPQDPGKDQTKTADAGTGEDQTKTADAGTDEEDQTKTADAGTDEDQTKTADAGTDKEDQTKTAGTDEEDQTKTADAGTDEEDQTKTADAGTDEEDQTKTADAGTGGEDQTKTADAGTDEEDQTKTADTGTGGDQTKTADTGTGGEDQTKTADTGTGGEDQTKTADAGTGGDQTKTADTGTGGEDQTKTADAGTGEEDQRKTADAGTGEEDQTKTADAGTGEEDQTKTADAGTGGEDQTKTADTGTGGEDQTKTADTGTGGEDQTKTADAGTGEEDQTKTADAGASCAAAAATSALKTPSPKKKKKKKKKKGGVDVDGKGVDLAHDLMKGATGSWAEEEAVAAEDFNDDSSDDDGGDGADDYVEPEMPNPVSLMVALCEARLQSLPKKGRKFARLGYKNQEKCPALGIDPKCLEEVGKDLATRLCKLEAAEQQAVLLMLWSKEHREYQLLVVEMVTYVIIPQSRELGFPVVFSFLEELICTKSGRDTVDRLARCHLNALTYLEPPDTWPVMDEWIKDDNQPWLQRAALLHQICLGEYMDWERLERYCKRFFNMSPHTDEFEERWTAIEQALNSYANNCKKAEEDTTAADKAIAFLEEHAQRARGRMKECLKALQKQVVDSKRQRLRQKMRTRKK